MRPWLVALVVGAVVIAVVLLVLRIRSDTVPAMSMATSVATTEATTGPAPTAVRPETYVSPNFGYAITYDDAAWMTTSAQFDITMDGVPRQIDQMYFDHRTLADSINVMGERAYYDGSGDMPTCAEAFVAGYTDLAEFAAVTEPVAGGGDGQAWMQYDFDDATSGVRTTLYAECRWLGHGVTLTVHHMAPAAEFAQGTALREQLLAGLDTSRVGVATPVPSPDAESEDDQLETYESPRFGYTLTYDGEGWFTSTGQGSGFREGHVIQRDTIDFQNMANTATLRITGETGWISRSSSMPDCVEDELLAFTIWDDLQPLASPVPGGGDGQAWIQADYEIEGVPTTVYIECRWLGGDVTLKVEQTAPSAEFPQWSDAREDVLAGLDTTGLVGTDATPVATPAASPAAYATPVASPVGAESS